MEMISVQSKTNFFEKRVSEYALADKKIDSVNSLEGTRARIQLILQRNSQSLGGADTTQAHELAMIQSTEAELINTIRDLREEAREIAAEEHFELLDTHLRNDV